MSMNDEYTRALAEIQGCVSEVTSCAIMGRSVDEATPQLAAAQVRAEEVAADLRRRAATLDAAVSTARRITGAI